MPKAKTAADEMAAAKDEDLREEPEWVIDFDEDLEDFAEEEEESATPGSIPVTAPPKSASAASGTTSTSTSSSKKGTSTMNQFKVGDYVTGKDAPENGYYILNNKSVSEVLEISSEGIMVVKLLYSEDPAIATSKYLGKEYKDCCEAAMRLSTEDEILKAKAASTPKSKKSAADKPAITITLKTDLYIKKYDSGDISSSFNKFRDTVKETDDIRKKALEAIIEHLKDRKAEDIKNTPLSELTALPDVGNTFDDILGDKYIRTMLTKMIDFFKEFQFEPNFRFINTLARKSGIDGYKDAQDYVRNYFKLTNHAFADAITDKITSPEFKEMVYALGTKDCNTIINKRFKVYYGSQGTGKTTKAMVETSGRCIVCNNSMLPQDLMEDFTFDDGKPGFHPSVLAECMQKGTGITLDEINLLPFETIRFLQGIVDGKKEFIWKGNTIKIKEGFNIIGTMNLVVNGMAFGLPEPLVDRCSSIEKSQLTAENLMGCLA